MEYSATGNMVTFKKPFDGKSILILATIGANLLFLSTGCVLTWSSPTIPKLVASGVLSEDEGSWVGSVFGLGGVLGPFLTAVCLDSLGRRATLAINAFVFLASWGLLCFPDVFYLMIVARVIAGVAVGASFTSIPIYITEIADDNLRQAMGSLNEICIGVGYLLEYGCGPWVSYHALLGVSAGASLIFIAICAFLPESPYHLINTGRREKAVDTLGSLRGRSAIASGCVNDEIHKIEKFLNDSKHASAHFCDLFRHRSALKGLLISFYVMTAVQLSGVSVLEVYTETIFELTKSESIKSSVGPLWFGSANIIASLLAGPTVKWFGLKSVFISTGVVMAFCQVSMSGYFYLLEEEFDLTSVSYLPVIVFTIYNAAFCIGVGPLSWLVIAEMFSPKLKGKASALVAAWGWLLAFASVKTFFYFVQLMSAAGLFGFFGVAQLIGSLGLICILPNTKGKSFNEIQHILKVGEKAAAAESQMSTTQKKNSNGEDASADQGHISIR